MLKNGLKYMLFIGIWAIITSWVFSYTQETMDAYLWSYKNWITTQNTIEKANINWNLTRQAMAKMIVNFSKNILKTAKVKVSDKNACKFDDENSITEDLRESVKEACELWLMWKWVKSFDPKDTLTRWQFWTILSRALWWDTYDWWEPYYEKHLIALQEAGIMSNIDNPDRKELRWNVMIMLMRWETLIKDFSKWNAEKAEKQQEKELTPWKWVKRDKNAWTLTISYNKRSITMQDKNLWAIEAGIWEKSIGHLFVWGINKWFYFDDSKNSTWFLAAKQWTWKEGDKWPCPKGYHIPTKSEWQAVIDLWKNNNPKLAEKWQWKKFSEDLLLPAIGTRQEAAWRAEGNKELWAPHQAYYWVSTPNRLLTWTVSSWNSHLYLFFDTKPIFWWSWAPEIWWAYANWNIEVAIRCFKWEVISNATSSSSTSNTSTKSNSKTNSSNSSSTTDDSFLPKFSFYF